MRLRDRRRDGQAARPWSAVWPRWDVAASLRWWSGAGGNVSGERVVSTGFPTTAWTVVSRARSGADPEARDALAFLCAIYWFPLYSFARRLGHASDDALDLTQGYFALLIEKDYLADVRLREGRFRAFLLTSFRHFVSKERDRAPLANRRPWRPGRRAIVSIPSDDTGTRPDRGVQDQLQVISRRNGSFWPVSAD